MLSVGAISVSKTVFALGKRWDGGGGWAKSRHDVHMVAVLVARFRWAISLLFWTNGYRNRSSAFVGAPFLPLETVFSQEKRSLVGEP